MERRAVELLEHLATQQKQIYQQRDSHNLAQQVEHRVANVVRSALAHDLKNTFIETEEETGEALYQNWLTTSESGIRQGFRDLFMQQEVTLREAMQEEMDDNGRVDSVDDNDPENG